MVSLINPIELDQFNEFTKSNIFDLHGHKELEIKVGDDVIITMVGQTYHLHVIGYGTIPGRYSINVFYFVYPEEHITHYNTLYDFSWLLSQKGVGVYLSSPEDFYTYFNDRPKEQPMGEQIKQLEEHLNGIRGVTIRGHNPYNKKNFRLPFEEIGNPDWYITIKINSNQWGLTPLSKIASVARDFKGMLFIHCHNHRGTGDYINCSTMFFSLCGVGITPLDVLERLKRLT
jgi:hypothetical protein